MHYKRDTSLPPTFRIATPTGLPKQQQPKGRKNSRFSLALSPIQLITKDFHLQKALFIPTEMLESDDIKRSTADRCQQQIKMILETITINSIDCWIWAGATRGGYPIVSYYKQQKGVMKVLVGWLTGADMDYVVTRKFCQTTFCINPAHYHFENFPYNIPRDGDLLQNIYGIILEPGEERIFWRTNTVYPWFPLNSQEKPLEAITPELQQKLFYRKSLAFLTQFLLVDKGKIPQPGDDIRGTLKVTPTIAIEEKP